MSESAPNQVSFLPDDYFARKSRLRSYILCGTLFGITLLAVGAAFVITERLNRDIQLQRDAVDARYAEAAKRIAMLQQLEDNRLRMAQQAELSASLLEKVPRSQILATVKLALPESVALLEFDLQSKLRPTPPPPPRAPLAPGTFESDAERAAKAGPQLPKPKEFDVSLKMVGTAGNDGLVATLMSQLSRSPLFRDVNLQYTEQLKGDESTVRKFEINLTVRDDMLSTGPGTGPKGKDSVSSTLTQVNP
jgi:Fimbrial assembly protein (PilN)